MVLVKAPLATVKVSEPVCSMRDWVRSPGRGELEDGLEVDGTAAEGEAPVAVFCCDPCVPVDPDKPADECAFVMLGVTPN
jgi:hypothetical protein